MEISYCRIIGVKKDLITFEYTDDPYLIMEKTVEEHMRATGRVPKIGEVFEFETEGDYDGCYSIYKRKKT